MKKLLCMMLGLAVGAFAYGEGTDKGGDYGFTANEGGGTETLSWVGAGEDDESEAVPYGTDEAKGSAIYNTGTVGKPYTEIGKITDTKYFKVKNSLSTPGYFTNESAPTFDFSKTVCFDTLVRFTAGIDAASDTDLPTLGGGKIGVWLKQVDTDTGIEGETNLYVTAGFWDTTESKYIEKAFPLNKTVEPGTWHRVTIRTIQNVLESSVNPLAGFLVYIDGDLATGDETYNIGLTEGLTTAATKLAGEKKLFISATGEGFGTSAQIGFAGNGDIDDTSITWGNAVPSFAIDAVDTTITGRSDKLLKVAYKVGEDGTFVTSAVPVNIALEKDTKIYFDKDGFEFEASEAASYAVDSVDQWDVLGWSYSDTDDSWTFNGTADGYLKIAVKETLFAVTLYDKDGNFIGGLAEADLSKLPAGFEGTIKFLKQVKTTDYSIPANTEIAIADRGQWTVTVPNGKSLEWYAGFENGKLVVVNGDIVLGGLIKGGDPIAETTVTVNGVCTIDSEGGLTIGDASNGLGAALIIGEDGELVTGAADEAGLITLGLNGRLVVGDPISEEGYDTVFENIPTDYEIDETVLKDEQQEIIGYQYNLKAVAKDYVAEIGSGEKFETLAEAFDEADATDTVTLLADCELNTQYALTKNITLVLNGKTLSKDAAKSADGKNKMIIVQGGATLTVDGSVEGSTVKGGLYAGVSASSFGTIVANGGSYYPAEGMDDCAFQSNGYAQSGAGNTITITGATIYSANDIAVYLAGAGTYTITGCTIDAATGIYLKGGALTMTDTTITAKGEFLATLEPEGNGAKSTGDGIVVDAKVGYAGNVSLNLGAGNDVSSVNGYAVRDALSDKNETALSALTITDGKYVSGTEKEAVIVADATKTTVSITGGKFGPVAPAANLAPAGYEFALKEGFYELQAKTFNITYEFVDENDQPLVGVTNPYAETTTFKVTDENIAFTENATLEGYTFSAWNPTGITCAETFADVTVTGKFTKDAPAEITITLVKTESIADIKANGTSVDGEVKLPADTTSIELELVAASTIKIPVYKVSYAEVGANVTTKKTAYTIADGNTLTFSAEEASSGDTQVTEEVAKQAFKDLGDDEAAKIEALTTGTDPIAAKAVATWINGKGLDPKTVLAGEFVKASVKLDTTLPITTETPVKIETLTKGEGTVLTFKVKVGADDVSTKAAITSMVKATDDLTKKAWELAADVAIDGETVKVTPPTGKTQAFVKVVIPADVPAAE